jgi:hypothetical protein
MARFKMRDTVKQACYIAGVSYDQFRYFALVHPWVYHVIRVYKSLVPHRLKSIVISAALGGQDVVCEVCGGKGKINRGTTECPACKGQGSVKSQPDAKIALGALRFFGDMEEEPELSPLGASPLAPSTPLPAGGSLLTEVRQAFLDDKGKMVLSRKVQERLQSYDDGGEDGE